PNARAADSKSPVTAPAMKGSVTATMTAIPPARMAYSASVCPCSARRSWWVCSSVCGKGGGGSGAVDQELSAAGSQGGDSPPPACDGSDGAGDLGEGVVDLVAKDQDGAHDDDGDQSDQQAVLG